MNNPIFLTSSSSHLKMKAGNLHFGRFANGEVSAVLDANVKNKKVVLIGSTGAPAENLIELFWGLETIARNGAAKVVVFIPNFGYAKSDKEKVKGQSLSASAILKVLKVLGNNTVEVATINIHSETILKTSVLSIKDISVIGLLASKFKENKNLAIVSPDDGGVKRAYEFANFLNIKEIVTVTKQRVWDSAVKVVNINGEVNGKDCVVVDDRVESGDTIQACVKTLVEKGAQNIFVSTVHMDYGGGGYLKLSRNKSILKVITTNTTKPPTDIPNKIEIVDISKVIKKFTSEFVI